MGPSPSDYQIVLHWSEPDRCYVATLPAWQQAQTHGATLAEAGANAGQVLEMLIAAALENGEPIPPPDGGIRAIWA